MKWIDTTRWNEDGQPNNQFAVVKDGPEGLRLQITVTYHYGNKGWYGGYLIGGERTFVPEDGYFKTREEAKEETLKRLLEVLYRSAEAVRQFMENEEKR